MNVAGARRRAGVKRQKPASGKVLTPRSLSEGLVSLATSNAPDAGASNAGPLRSGERDCRDGID